MIVAGGLLVWLLAAPAGAADSPKPTPQIQATAKRDPQAHALSEGVLEIQIHLRSKTPKESRDATRKAVEPAGGRAVLGAAGNDIIFAFPPAPLFELRARMEKAIDGIRSLDIGVLGSQKISLSPALDERQAQIAVRRIKLQEERAKLGKALQAAPLVTALIDSELARVADFDAAREPRRGALFIRVDDETTSETPAGSPEQPGK